MKSEIFDRGEKRVRVFAERRLATPDEVRARQERMERLLEELRASVARKKAIVDKWRAEGLLPPEEPRRRI
jgi:hypothetical protein